MSENKNPTRRTKRRALLWMGLTLVSGLAATTLVMRYVKSNEPRTANVATEAVVVAITDLPAGMPVDGKLVKISKYPVGLAPEGALSAIGAMKGRVPKTPIFKGETIIESKLIGAGGGSGLAALIPEHMRAMAVKVNEVIGVAGFIHANDVVDIIAVMTPRVRNDDREAHARVIIQGVQVLAVGNEMQEDKKGRKAKQVTVATLLVTPEDSERLALATEEGDIRLALRGRMDKAPIETAGINESGLILVAKAPRRGRRSSSSSKPAETPEDVVEVFRGATLEERKIKSASWGDTGGR